MKRDRIKTAIAVVVAVYFLWCAWEPYEWHLIDGVNLVIHEAGHIIFMPFGEFVMIAGGSLFQVIVPTVFVIYFYKNRKPYSAALVMFWAGESLLNVSVYAGDSVALQLPLLGGQDSVHDWNYMLDHLGLLNQTPAIAGSIRLLATLVILAAAVLSLKSATVTAKDPLDDHPEEFLEFGT
jgi:hypothetical protein